MPSRAWGAQPWGVLDTEATSVNAATASLLAVAVLEIDTDGTVLPDPLDLIVDPSYRFSGPLTEEVLATAGLTGTEVVEAPLLREKIPEIVDRIMELSRAGVPIVCFNAPYHWSLIVNEYRRYGHQLHWGRERGPEPHFIDPLVIDRCLYPNVVSGGRRLGAMAARYAVPVPETDRKWMRDAILAAGIARRQSCAFATNYTPAELHRLQQVEHRQHMVDLAGYLRGRGHTERAVQVQMGWPFQ